MKGTNQNLPIISLPLQPLNIGVSPQNRIAQMEQPYSSMVLSFPYMTHFIKCPYTRASIVYKDLHPGCIYFTSIQVEDLNSGLQG